MSVTFPKGHLTQAQELVNQCRDRDDFDVSLRYEVQTDKELVKIVPCQHCKRPLVVTTFYVLAWAKCNACRGEDGSARAKGSVEVVQAGRTNPALAKDLTKVLINPTFANARCPVRPDDDEHEMELKSVNHNDRYGPTRPQLIDGKLVMVQFAPGETVMHQCNKCLAVVTYTTTAVSKFRRCNEPGVGKNANGWAEDLGVRDDDEEGAVA